MNEISQRKVFRYFLKKGIKNFVGVPDSTLKYFIDEAIKTKKIIIATREEEAIGIATGMHLAKKPSVVFMQNAGFANSLSTITSLVELYEIPLIFVIGWRGYLHNDAPEHLKIGKIQPELLKAINLKHKVATEKNWKACCNWAIDNMEKKRPCALVIRRLFHD